MKLIKAVDRPSFAVHMDICNGINSPERFYRNADFTRDCFKKPGKWIVSCHAKDLAFIPEYNVHFKEVVPGRGEIDYATYLRELTQLPVDAPLMLEHLTTPDEYLEGRDYIRSVTPDDDIAAIADGLDKTTSSRDKRTKRDTATRGASD